MSVVGYCNSENVQLYFSVVYVILSELGYFAYIPFGEENQG